MGADTRVVISNSLGRSESIVPQLEAAGCHLLRLPDPQAQGKDDWSSQEIETFFRDADAIVGLFAPRPISRRVLEAATRLRVCVSPVIGTEGFDVRAATDLGIAVGYGAASENFVGVAEANVMLAAALLKNLPGKWQAVKERGWRTEDPGHMVMNHTVGLVGLGNIGRATAKRLQGWDSTSSAPTPSSSRRTLPPSA